MTPKAFVILCTAPDADTGTRLARGLVERRLAACVNILPGIRSVYRWKDQVHDEPEVQLLIKTRIELLEAAKDWLTAHHPYEVPEILAVPVLGGGIPYLEWLAAETAYPEETVSKAE